MNLDPRSCDLLFVDDEEDFRSYVTRNLTGYGYNVVTTAEWKDARTMLQTRRIRPRVIFLEPLSLGPDSVKLSEICSEARRVPVVVLSSCREPERIVDAIQQGARDYLCKPLNVERFPDIVERILHQGARSVSAQVARCRSSDASRVQFVLQNPKMRQLHEKILKVARTNVPVLLEGETGVGKDIVSRVIHEKSHLAEQPFVKVNCAALPGELVESELFGYRKGAFTGALDNRPGKFEFAHGGTLFLDEIGEFQPAVQAKLLQVLQDGRFSRLGSDAEVEVRVRIIAASNRNLKEDMRRGRFREDLYYRLNVVNFHVPPLRERKDEIPALCRHFFEKFKQQYNSSLEAFPKELLPLFQSYDWSGNVRELENVIKRYVIFGDTELIESQLEEKISSQTREQLDQLAAAATRNDAKAPDLRQIGKKAAALAERGIILKTLHKRRWNKWKAAKDLRVSYKTFLGKIKQYGISLES